MRDIIIIAHDIRSTHNIGSLLRTADGIGISMVYLTGYTPYPSGAANDQRLPHEVRKLDAQINKTALGAEKTVAWQHVEDVNKVIESLKSSRYEIVALEQTSQAVALSSYRPTEKVALVLGREVEGVENDILALIPQHVYIPMFGKKESFNVVQAAAMALYHIRFAK